MTENMNKLITVVQVLNNIDTRGKQNLVNLGGAIGLIEDVINSLGNEEVSGEDIEATQEA